jgi:hypothetical protein
MRIPDNPWKPAMERATREGTTLTAVVIAFLRRYAAGTAVLALILAGGVGAGSQAARASAPVTPASNVVTEALYVVTVRALSTQVFPDGKTSIDNLSDAELIAAGKATCARAAHWRQVADPAYGSGSDKFKDIIRVTLLTFC